MILDIFTKHKIMSSLSTRILEIKTLHRSDSPSFPICQILHINKTGGVGGKIKKSNAHSYFLSLLQVNRGRRRGKGRGEMGQMLLIASKSRDTKLHSHGTIGSAQAKI